MDARTLDTFDTTKDLLRFITCGSVDDGKSTLIGRLLHDSMLIHDDQLQALAVDSARIGTTGGDTDFALLVDGLEAEREQGITIDVAYRFFTTPRRSFVVADTPGHEQYTRNMATGASTAQLAIILIDARKGVLVQTRRHSFICSLLGIRHVLLAVNKIDLVDYDQQVFDAIATEFSGYAKELGIHEVTAIPISALHGDNVVTRSERIGWYTGRSVLEHLENVDLTDDSAQGPLRFPVQYVIRPRSDDLPDYRGYAGRVAAGTVRPGDEILALPSGLRSTVTAIDTADGEKDVAVAGESVTLLLAGDLTNSRICYRIRETYQRGSRGWRAWPR